MCNAQLYCRWLWCTIGLNKERKKSLKGSGSWAELRVLITETKSAKNIKKIFLWSAVKVQLTKFNHDTATWRKCDELHFRKWAQRLRQQCFREWRKGCDSDTWGVQWCEASARRPHTTESHRLWWSVASHRRVRPISEDSLPADDSVRVLRRFRLLLTNLHNPRAWKALVLRARASQPHSRTKVSRSWRLGNW